MYHIMFVWIITVGMHISFGLMGKMNNPPILRAKGL